jgi:hypothetical protein
MALCDDTGEKSPNKYWKSGDGRSRTYALSEHDNELFLLLDGRDHVNGKLKIQADYFVELGPNRSTEFTRKLGTVHLSKGKIVSLTLKFSYEDWE